MWEFGLISSSRRVKQIKNDIVIIENKGEKNGINLRISITYVITLLKGLQRRRSEWKPMGSEVRDFQ